MKYESKKIIKRYYEILLLHLPICCSIHDLFTTQKINCIKYDIFRLPSFSSKIFFFLFSIRYQIHKNMMETQQHLVLEQFCLVTITSYYPVLFYQSIFSRCSKKPLFRCCLLLCTAWPKQPKITRRLGHHVVGLDSRQSTEQC